MKTKLSKALALILSVCLLAGCTKAEPASYTGEAQGYGGKVSVTISVDEKGKILSVESVGEKETEAVGGAALPKLDEKALAAQSAEIEAEAGATVTSEAYKSALADAIALSKGEELPVGELKFTPGTYEGKGEGFGGEIVLSVVFTEDGIDNIDVVSHKETAHVGTSAIDLLLPEIEEYTCTGVDGVAGATITSNALKAAVEDAATQAGCDVRALQKGAKEYKLTPGEDVEKTFDVVVVGAGGAGMSAAAELAQQGKSVVIVEKEADMGGNTLVAGCAFQAFYQYKVWDPADPEATTGVCPYDGKTYEKSKANLGTLNILRTIYNWNEDEFDGTIDADHPFTAGDMEEVSKRGVHPEWLPVLKELKEEIKVYLDWADAKMAAGAKETDLTLFSTTNLHMFQTYYGGLRANNAGTDWIYSDVDLVRQLVENIPADKQWLADQGSVFDWDSITNTLIGCMWQRINRFKGGMINGTMYDGAEAKYACYFQVPLNTVMTASDENELMLRTTAKELIVEDGKVVGVECEKYDGTKITLKANDGVILATGGYGANIEMVLENNEYWDSDKIGMDLLTTNRSLAMGEGITMAQAVGADVKGMGYTQLMPLGWAKDGKLAGGNGETVIFISPEGTENAGKRFVDESAERDVLSKGQLDFGGKNGLTIQLMNAERYKGGVVEQPADKTDKEYYMTLAEACEFLNLDYDTVYETVTTYDAAVIAQDLTTLPVHKGTATATILSYKEDGTPDLDTLLSVRFLAPSTHHTMGGLVVDTERHVLDKEGNAIPGLYAAGEVTTGFFAGNRLGGNAISEIIVSGRIAAQTIVEESK